MIYHNISIFSFFFSFFLFSDLYLTDHQGKSAQNDERKYWERKMNKILGGEENCDIEDIPSYLTPDADRGVTYSDEIIEMKVIFSN